MMRRVLLLGACVLLALAVCAVTAESTPEMTADPEMNSFLEAMSTADETFQAALDAEIGADAEKPRKSGGGGVQRGGRRKRRGPDMRKGTADGAELPPWDPFRIHKRHERKVAKQNAKRQAKADIQNHREGCRRSRRRAERRRRAEAREREQEKREAAEEAARQSAAGAGKKDGQVETDLMEVASSTEVDADSEAAMESEMLADSEEAAKADAEAEADAAEESSDLAEMEAEGEESIVQETEEILLESEAERKPRRVTPAENISYNREALAEENFNNGGGRAVFKRRARGQEIVRFSKLSKSDSGNAVVIGVNKLPCGKEITDKGLFSAVVLNNPGPTVEAANPQPPVWKDDNINAIHRLPVVPQWHEVGGVDEYGDAE